jgi:hypothetical protein
VRGNPGLRRMANRTPTNRPLVVGSAPAWLRERCTRRNSHMAYTSGHLGPHRRRQRRHWPKSVARRAARPDTSRGKRPCNDARRASRGRNPSHNRQQTRRYSRARPGKAHDRRQW